jgi:hypothetical protein
MVGASSLGSCSVEMSISTNLTTIEVFDFYIDMIKYHAIQDVIQI